MITLAKTAGFCFGVDRAVNIVYDLLEKGKKVATLGPIIHNPQLVNNLKNLGVRIIDVPGQAEKDEIIVIRSHGVAQKIYDEIKKMGNNFIDATCPYVGKIHTIVNENSNNGHTIIIAGDKSHPEVIGIQGHCVGNNYVISTVEELRALYYKLTEKEKNSCVLVAQTTFNQILWKDCIKIAKKLYTNAKKFDTICNATNVRQTEAKNLAKQNEIMLVIGGKESSNTKKLFDVCNEYTKTFLIETKDELQSVNFLREDNIGLTAGASTPAYIIKEVLKTMSDILRNEENEDFASMLEQSLESEKIYNGKRVIGIVTHVSSNEVHVDVGAKQAGIVPANEMSDDPNVKIEDLVKPGDEIELCVVKVNDQEGIVTLSKKRCDAAAGFDKLKKAFEANEVVDGVVTDVIRGGVLVYAFGTKIFVPASQCSDHHIDDLNTLLKNPVKFKVIEVNEARNRAKGSVKAVASIEREALQEKFWEVAEIGKTYSGAVKSLTGYGAFVDLGGIDGMIHISELSWGKIAHPSEIVKQGDVVDVYIKDLDKEKKRVSLGYKQSKDNPFNIFKQQYSIGDVASAKIVSFTNYGAFAEIMDGVDGLIHISQIANKHVDKIADVLKVGQVVDTKIVDIDENKRRVSLSMRALLNEDEQKKDRGEDEADTAEEIAE